MIVFVNHILVVYVLMLNNISFNIYKYLTGIKSSVTPSLLILLQPVAQGDFAAA